MITPQAVGITVVQTSAGTASVGSALDSFASREAEGTRTPILSGLLRNVLSAWKWIEQKRVRQSAMRRLRVAETISLGEKRFVSIVQVDGCDYLIGGAAGSVSLLTALAKQPSFNETLQQRAQAETEYA